MKRLHLGDEDKERRILSVAARSGYNIKDDSSGRWLENSLTVKPYEYVRITPSNISDVRPFIDAYTKEVNIAGGINYNKCLDLLAKITKGVSPENVEYFKRGIVFCPQNKLKELFEQGVAPLFFGVFPGGEIYLIRSSGAYHYRIAFIRFLYTLSLYPEILNYKIGTDFEGFRTLVHWNNLDPRNYPLIILTIMQYLFYPYLTGFSALHGTNLDISFVFPQTIKEEKLFPSYWIDFMKSKINFAKEARENNKVHERSVYGKYYFEEPSSFDDSKALIEWAIKSLNNLATRLYDVTRFLSDSDDEVIDPIYAYEYSQTIMHIFRDAASIITSDMSYQNKSVTFRIADLLSRLAKIGTLKKNEGDYFKELFRSDKGKFLVKDILTNADVQVIKDISQVVETIYENLKKSILDSIWVPDKRRASGISVKGKDLAKECIETEDEFLGNVIRALRNTHHGYFTRGDPKTKPSRYLSIINGNTSDDFPTLAIAWILALLASPERFVGTP
jgi:hypothetical protein